MAECCLYGCNAAPAGVVVFLRGVQRDLRRAFAFSSRASRSLHTRLPVPGWNARTQLARVVGVVLVLLGGMPACDMC